MYFTAIDTPGVMLMYTMSEPVKIERKDIELLSNKNLCSVSLNNCWVSPMDNLM